MHRLGVVRQVFRSNRLLASTVAQDVVANTGQRSEFCSLDSTNTSRQTSKYGTNVCEQESGSNDRYNVFVVTFSCCPLEMHFSDNLREHSADP